MTNAVLKSILKNEKFSNRNTKRKHKTMKKKYEKISACIVEISQDAVRTSGESNDFVSRTSMADIDDVYDFGWISEVK